jgi:hypothetical protein
MNEPYGLLAVVRVARLTSLVMQGSVVHSGLEVRG